MRKSSFTSVLLQCLCEINLSHLKNLEDCVLVTVRGGGPSMCLVWFGSNSLACYAFPKDLYDYLTCSWYPVIL